MVNLQSGSSKRVKGIFSVIASTNRLEILKILNAKGSLSYSELKSLAGFRSKKESGKFAYHLRKLVRQGLVSLNRAERRYVITSLGNLILNLSRQIEEHAVIESGKLYVRTSKQKIEEFNANKITQSLVKEGGMPLDLAQKITAEVESKIYKFQTTYLTAPLIREIVNAVLIEQGYEEYRHKLTRLGLPIHDVIELINKVGAIGGGVEALVTQTAQSVFSEFLLLNQLTKDVADLHLSGGINISNLGRWGIAPDTLIVDTPQLFTSKTESASKKLTIPKLTPPTNLSEALLAHTASTILLASECNTELCWVGFNEYLEQFAKDVDDKELAEEVFKELVLLSTSLAYRGASPLLSLYLEGEDHSESNFSSRVPSILEGYRKYIEVTPFPSAELILRGNLNEEALECIYKVLMTGGCLAFSPSIDSTYSYTGLKVGASSEERPFLSMLLHGFSINLPRLARDAQEDEIYFRAKMTILLRDALGALQSRRGIIIDQIRKGVLPIIASRAQIAALEESPLILNLAGLIDAAQMLVKEKGAQDTITSIVEKTIETAVKETDVKADIKVAMVPEEGLARLTALDAEKYGKTAIIPQTKEGYSTTIRLEADKLDEAKLKLAEVCSRNLNGGCSISVKIQPNIRVEDLRELIRTLATRLNFFRIGLDLNFCRNCGAKNASTATRCSVCKSTMLAKRPVY